MAPFGGDPRRNAQARPPVFSNGSKSRATCAKPPNDDQKRHSALSGHDLTSTRGNKIWYNSRLALRTLRNRSRDYERIYQRQIADGRPDVTWMACGVSHCGQCTFYDRMSMYNHNSRRFTAWREEIFVELMVEVLARGNSARRNSARGNGARGNGAGGNGARGNGARGNAVSLDDIDSFIQSPPIRGAFWEFHKTCGVTVQEVEPAAMLAKLTGLMPAVVRLVRAPVIGEVRLDRGTGDVKEKRHAVGWYLGDLAILRRGGRRWDTRDKMKKEERETLDVHLCFSHYLAGRPQTWKLEDYLLQFCVVAESWRRYGLQRGCRWGFGGAEKAADLICAVLLNWWIMTGYDCFEKRRHNRLSINLLWEEWMERYPRFLQGDEMEEQGSSSEKVLHGVGRAVMLGVSAKC